MKKIDRVYTYSGVLVNAFIMMYIPGIVVVFLMIFVDVGATSTQDSLAPVYDWLLRISDYLINTLPFIMLVGLSIIIFITYQKQRLIALRPSKIAALAKRHKYTYTAEVKNMIRSSNFMLLQQRDAKVNNCLSTDDWIYGELSYDIYRKIKDDEYKSETVYYSLLEIPLSRALPNMFFDSSQAHGRQFRWLINPNQITSLEGNFDTYFTTYFPEQYHIDARSIISPEVMQALIAMHPSDVEISGDSLFIYSALLPTDEIVSFTKKAMKIRDVMMDHAVYYVDSLNTKNDKTAISFYGTQLTKRNIFPWASLIILIIVILPMAHTSFSRQQPEQQFWVVLGMLVILQQIYQWFRHQQHIVKRRQRLYKKIISQRKKA